MSVLEELSPEEREWLIADERRWRRADELAERNCGVDVGGIYRVLRNLEKTPAERLRSALSHGRLFGVQSR
jgi:hypothetical protein